MCSARSRAAPVVMSVMPLMAVMPVMPVVAIMSATARPLPVPDPVLESVEGMPSSHFASPLLDCTDYGRGVWNIPQRPIAGFGPPSEG